MSAPDKRRHPRRQVKLEAFLALNEPAPIASVIDLSESGAGLEWSLPQSIAIGTPVRLSFLLPGTQTIEIDARVVRISTTHAGVEFVAAQQDVVRQLLAEARSDD